MNIFRFWQSLRDASRGVDYVFHHEQNFRLQIFLALLTLLLTFFFNLRGYEIILIILLIVLVLILELLNSVLEKFIDLLKPRLDYQVKIIKDIAAGMVFISSIGALIIGVIIFWPHVIEFIKFYSNP